MREDEKIKKVHKELNKLKSYSRKITHALSLENERLKHLDILNAHSECSIEEIARYKELCTQCDIREYVKKSSDILERYSTGIKNLSPEEDSTFYNIFLLGQQQKEVADLFECSVSRIQKQVSSIIKKIASSI